MRGFVRGSAAGAAALLVAGCVQTAGSSRPDLIAASAPTASTSAATWQMPRQILPVADLSKADEDVVVAEVPQVGPVRGTRTALASVGTPLRAAAGRNRTVQACRGVVESEAAKIGARAVEAVSAGPDRVDAKGRYVGQVRMRITYARPNGLEVREATMTCIVDRKGKIVDAYA